MKIIGIYKITNKINGKVYIGQSWNTEKRWKEHKANDKCTHNIHLYNAFQKYGIENFEFEIIRTFIEGGLTQLLLDFFENYYIKFYNAMNNKKGYNKKEGGSNGKLSDESKNKIAKARKGKKESKETIEKRRLKLIGLKRSKESKENISKALSGRTLSEEHKKNIGISSTGRTHSEETKKLIGKFSKNNKNMLGKHHTEETKKLIGNHSRGLNSSIKRKIICIDTKEIFPLMIDACNKYNLDPSTLTKVCKKQRKKIKKLNFMYYEDYLKENNITDITI